MRVLVACESSAVVRDAFRARGHDAWSVDILPTEGDPRWHLIGDAREVLDDGWDLMVAHPPCTDLAVSGARWFAGKLAADPDCQLRALGLVDDFLNAPIPRVAVENPVSIISTRIERPAQIIQPWMFGHGEVKATCLWLRGLPPLRPSNVVDGRDTRVWRMGPSPDRWRERSRTLPGIAAAMADQWGSLDAAQAAA